MAATSEQTNQPIVLAPGAVAGAAPAPGVPAPESVSTPTATPRLSAVKRILTNGWTVAGAIASAVASVIGWYAGSTERRARLDRVDHMISALHDQKSVPRRLVAFDSLRNASISDNLELHVIQGLFQFVRAERPLGRPCANASARGDSVGRDVQAAFRAIRGLQRREHSVIDRVVNVIFAVTTSRLVQPTRPAELDRTDLRHADLTGLDLRAASFRGACLVGARLDSARLDSARLDSARLDAATFEGARMRSASLSSVRGKGANFSYADLTDAVLSKAELRSVVFLGASLSCATFGRATLDSAFMTGAVANWSYFGGASFSGATHWDEIVELRMTFLAQTVGLSPRELQNAHKRGAAPDDIDSQLWSDGRSAQLRPGGACAPGR